MGVSSGAGFASTLGVVSAAKQVNAKENIKIITKTEEMIFFMIFPFHI